MKKVLFFLLVLVISSCSKDIDTQIPENTSKELSAKKTVNALQSQWAVGFIEGEYNPKFGNNKDGILSLPTDIRLTYQSPFAGETPDDYYFIHPDVDISTPDNTVSFLVYSGIPKAITLVKGYDSADYHVEFKGPNQFNVYYNKVNNPCHQIYFIQLEDDGAGFYFDTYPFN